MGETFKPTSSNYYTFGKCRQSKDGKWRRCYVCKEWKPIDDYHFWRTPKKGYLTDYCKECRPQPKPQTRPVICVVGATSTKYLYLPERAKMVAYFGGKCAYCNKPLTDEYRGVVVEHFKGISSGGESTYDNLVISCRFCNHSKGKREAYSWLVKKFGYSEKTVDNLILE